MTSKWTVTPETTKRDGVWRGEPFWVRLKTQLTAGEQLRMQTSAFTRYNIPARVLSGAEEAPLGKVDVDFSALSLGRILAYVVEWSLEDDQRRRLPIGRATVEALHPEFVDVLNGLINEHECAQAEEKKVQPGASGPAAMSA